MSELICEKSENFVSYRKIFEPKRKNLPQMKLPAILKETLYRCFYFFVEIYSIKAYTTISIIFFEKGIDDNSPLTKISLEIIFICRELLREIT